MSGRGGVKLASGRRRRAGSKATTAISPLPPPEDVFVEWLLSVPYGVDLETAARRQVALIDRHVPLHPDAHVLRDLLAAVAAGSE